MSLDKSMKIFLKFQQLTFYFSYEKEEKTEFENCFAIIENEGLDPGLVVICLLDRLFIKS